VTSYGDRIDSITAALGAAPSAEQPTDQPATAADDDHDAQRNFHAQDLHVRYDPSNHDPPRRPPNTTDSC